MIDTIVNPSTIHLDTVGSALRQAADIVGRLLTIGIAEGPEVEAVSAGIVEFNVLIVSRRVGDAGGYSFRQIVCNRHVVADRGAGAVCVLGRKGCEEEGTIWSSRFSSRWCRKWRSSECAGTQGCEDDGLEVHGE